MNEQLQDKEKGITEKLGNTLSAVNKAAPAVIVILLCLILGFFAGSHPKETKRQTMYDRYRPEMEMSDRYVPKNIVDSPLELDEDAKIVSKKTDFISAEKMKNITEAIWDNEISTPRDLISYAVKNENIDILEYLVNALEDNETITMNLSGVERFKQNKKDYRSEVLDDIKKTTAADQKYQETVKEIKARTEEKSLPKQAEVIETVPNNVKN